ncbi:MAG: phosphoglycerate mutase family protein [Acidobacteria bacterium]|nr:phosphoglycerate mutase family protein [Acidobacteriota bacterium]
MTTLVFMRHGETAWNRAGRYLSRTDVALDEQGLRDVRSAVPVLAVPDSPLAASRSSLVLVSSPLRRAVQTAEIAAETLGVPVRETWDDLREVDFGVFEGETEASAMRGAFADAFPAWRDPSSGNVGAPEGESWSTVDDRARRVLDRLGDLGRDALVVSHGCFIRAILAHAVLGLSSHQLRRFRLDNAAFVVLSGSPSNWIVTGLNVRTIS